MGKMNIVFAVITVLFAVLAYRFLSEDRRDDGKVDPIHLTAWAFLIAASLVAAITPVVARWLIINLSFTATGAFFVVIAVVAAMVITIRAVFTRLV